MNNQRVDHHFMLTDNWEVQAINNEDNISKISWLYTQDIQTLYQTRKASEVLQDIASKMAQWQANLWGPLVCTVPCQWIHEQP